MEMFLVENLLKFCTVSYIVDMIHFDKIFILNILDDIFKALLLFPFIVPEIFPCWFLVLVRRVKFVVQHFLNEERNACKVFPEMY